MPLKLLSILRWYGLRDCLVAILTWRPLISILVELSWIYPVFTAMALSVVGIEPRLMKPSEWSDAAVVV